MFAAQFGAMFGARVIATTGSAAKLERLRSLGVSDVIDQTSVHSTAEGVPALQGDGSRRNS